MSEMKGHRGLPFGILRKTPNILVSIIFFLFDKIFTVNSH